MVTTLRGGVDFTRVKFEDLRDLEVLSLGAGDLGGTNFTLGLFESRGANLTKSSEYAVAWKGSRDFGEVLDRLACKLGDSDSKVGKKKLGELLSQMPVLAIGAAGVSTDDKTVALKKYPGGRFEIWKALRKRGFRGRLFLPNDFVAQARSVATSVARRRMVIVPGRADSLAWGLVLGAGTGFGVGPFVKIKTPQGVRYFYGRSEGGNCSSLLDSTHQRFPVNAERNGFDKRVLHYLRFVEDQCLVPQDKRQLRAEIFVSGRGLSLAHQYVTGEVCEPKDVAQLVLPDEKDRDKLSRLHPTLVVFSYLYGQLVRNAVLWYGAWGGVYIAGGVAQKSPHLVDNAAFRAGYAQFGVHQETMGSIPVWLLLSKTTGFWGAAQFALDQVQNA